MYPIWWKKVTIFIWFELRTPSTPSTGSHPSTLGLSYWPLAHGAYILILTGCYSMYNTQLIREQLQSFILNSNQMISGVWFDPIFFLCKLKSEKKIGVQCELSPPQKKCVVIHGTQYTIFVWSQHPPPEKTPWPPVFWGGHPYHHHTNDYCSIYAQVNVNPPPPGWTNQMILTAFWHPIQVILTMM